MMNVLLKSSLIVLLAVLPAMAGRWVCPCDHDQAAADVQPTTDATCCPSSAPHDDRPQPDNDSDNDTPPACPGQHDCRHCELTNPLEAEPARDVSAIISTGQSIGPLLQANLTTPLPINAAAHPDRDFALTALVGSSPPSPEGSPVRAHTLLLI